MELHGKVASRYAKAILEWLGNAEKAKKVAQELKELGQLVGENTELRLVLTTSVFSLAARRSVLEEIFEKAGLSSETRKIVLVISEMKRVKALPAISFRLSELLLLSENIVPVEVASSQVLSGDEKRSIEGRFSKILGSPVAASYLVDPGLVGGVKVTASGKTYDGTLSGWLNHFEEVLVGGNI